MTKLSPAAQAVMDAAASAMEGGFISPDFIPYEGKKAAAILRALADQVVPELTTPWNSTLTPIIPTADVRAQILAMAEDLEGGNG